MADLLSGHRAGGSVDRVVDLTEAAPGPAEATPIAALLRRWPLGVVLVIVGAVAGAYYASAQPPAYTAEARVAVGEGDLSAGAIAGLPEAASLLASNYARYVTDRGLLGQGPSVTNAAVGASPIPSSNIIRIEAVSDSATDAREAAGQVAADLVAEVNARATSDRQVRRTYQKAQQAYSVATIAQQTVQARLTEVEATPGASAAKVAKVQARLARSMTIASTAELEKNAAAATYQSSLTASGAADLVLVAKGQVTGSDRSSRMQRYGILGFVLGGLLALVIAVLLERRRGRRRRPTRG